MIDIEISITDIEPMADFIQDIDEIVGYLRFKAKPTAMESRIINTYDVFYSEVDKDPDGKPSLKLL